LCGISVAVAEVLGFQPPPQLKPDAEMYRHCLTATTARPPRGPLVLRAMQDHIAVSTCTSPAGNIARQQSRAGKGVPQDPPCEVSR